mmetsp:Transcript_59343/g.94233  ORF Transcript_59343/g.94233 Transcript_59343/m.94233 type:complete len:145 (+) Transcript_59343:120-554(+)
MVFRSIVVALSLTVVPAIAKSLLGHRRAGPAASLADISIEAQTSDRLSITVIEERIRDFKAINPLFSESACTDMFATKVKLGGPVPPAQYVKGCTEVCDLLKKVKSYWGTGETAEFACGHVNNFGCAYDVADQVAPKTAKEIGC